MVCASRALRRGGVLPFALGEEPVVLFRGRDTGVVRAVPAHCLHQGVNLAHGAVAGDLLRCPLHHWKYSDRCETVAGPPPRFVVQERFGMIFIHAGATPTHPIPSFSVDDAALYFRSGKPVSIDCPWYVPVANAFDMRHLETVHRRRLTREPHISYPDPMTFRVDYATAVTGTGWSDRTMRVLSGNDIRVDVTTSGGTMLLVESKIRRRRGYLMVSLRPTREGVSILPLFGVPRNAARTHLLDGRVSAALFTAFLRRDIRALSGIRFPDDYTDKQDATISACYQYLCRLPEAVSEEI